MENLEYNYKPSEIKQDITNTLDKKEYIDERQNKILTRSEVIGKTLKYLRKRIGATQKYVANKIGIAQQTYAGYENGKHEPSIEIMIRLADLYEISMDYITCRFAGDIEERDRILEIETQEILENTVEHYILQRQSELEFINMIKKHLNKK